jgi:ElaB/YqjD/DUF883 family membrane-anchored ribosome-binding protein
MSEEIKKTGETAPEEKGFFDKIKDTFEDLKDKAEEVWEKVEDKAEDAWDATKEKVGDLKDKIVDKFDGDDAPPAAEEVKS